MFATAAGTARYVNRHPEFRDAGFYRTILDLKVSTLGLGTYLDASVDAICAAAEGGINFFDAAINYRNQQSERDLGDGAEAAAAGRDRDLDQRRVSDARCGSPIPEA